ncbi:hypothetical protein J6590_096821 [Homalodisca vitripennis]|nr:hypothetical protein J6590_096821 [Homalodisca vitripennis]
MTRWRHFEPAVALNCYYEYIRRSFTVAVQKVAYMTKCASIYFTMFDTHTVVVALMESDVSLLLYSLELGFVVVVWY